MTVYGLNSTGLYLRQKAKQLLTWPDERTTEGYFLRMRAEGGLGLAAPQIDIPIQLAVIEYQGIRLVLVNPVVTRMGGHGRHGPEKVTAVEGCLSLPGRSFEVQRSQEVHLDVRLPGERDPHLNLTAYGMLARIIQHEYDHLQGILVDTIGKDVTDDDD